MNIFIHNSLITFKYIILIYAGAKQCLLLPPVVWLIKRLNELQLDCINIRFVFNTGAEPPILINVTAGDNRLNWGLIDKILITFFSLVKS